MAQVASKLLMYSGPLSQRIRLGWPRHSMILSNALTTLLAGKEKSTNGQAFPVKVVNHVK